MPKRRAQGRGKKGRAPSERIKDSILTFLRSWDLTHGEGWTGPYSYQVPVMVDIVERSLKLQGGVITALMPRQSGKSEAIAMACFYLLMLSAMGGTPVPMKVGVVAPSEPQALLLTRKIREKIKRIEPQLRAYGILPNKDLESWMEWPNGTLLKALSGSKTAQVVGESFTLMVLDESQDIEDEVKQNRLDPMGAHYNAVRVYIGTPGFTPNFFYRALQDPDASHHIVRMEQAMAENPHYVRYVDAQRRELGEDSAAFRRQYLLEWLFNIGQPITYRDMEAMQRIGLERTLSYSELPAYVGLDLAKYEDSTVATVILDPGDGKVPQIAGWLELKGLGYEDQLQDLVLWLKRWPMVQLLVVDATGAGDPVLEWWKSARPDLKLEPFKFSAPSKDALYKEYLRTIEDRRLGIPQSAPEDRPTARASCTEAESLRRFISQHTTMQREVKHGLMLLHHPPGGHDDYADSAALALWGYLKRPPAPSAHMVRPSRPRKDMPSMGKYKI